MSQTIDLGTPPITLNALTCALIQSASPSDQRASARLRTELNPVENVWQFLRDNWLSNRIFKSYDDLVDHC
ncbi:MAG: hypothetical protein ACXWCH_34025, partial [Burkholderiales bacterium]